MHVITQKNLKKQSGAALAISLILLVTMTILGVSTLNSSRVAEKVSSNAQQKAIVFETSESVINSIYSSTDIGKKLRSSRTQLLDPDEVIQPNETALINDELDQTNTFGRSVDVTAEGSIQFCGEFPRQGTSLSADKSVPSQIGLHFDIRATSTISNSNAKAVHVSRIEDVGIALNSTGKCVAPGL